MLITPANKRPAQTGPEEGDPKKPRTGQTEDPEAAMSGEPAKVETRTSLDIPNPSIPWALIPKCLDCPVLPVNSLSVESCDTLLSSARPLARLARINKEMNDRYQGELSVMRWTHQLALRQGCWLNNYHNPSTELTLSNIRILIDENAYAPSLYQAPP